MHVFEHFRFTGTKQRWTVPAGVTEAIFECWGAAGGMPSDLAHEGKKRQVVGGTAPKNNVFYNNPNGQGQLGVSFANGAGYAAGAKAVSEGDVYYVYVGGNGNPGHSTIKLKDDGSYEVAFRGGDGGYNGGGSGGQGAHVHQNLFNSTSRKVHFAQDQLPGKAKLGQLWWDTNANTVYKCTLAYTSSGSKAANWTQVTHDHDHCAGPSGGGGGGATDIRYNGDDVAHRILVAGGGGGAGGSYNRTGSGSWSLHAVPGTPMPPFGTDSAGQSATGPDSTWCTATNYLTGTWGLGGAGGGSGPKPNTQVTTDTGTATTGGSGGNGTDRHEDGKAPRENRGSGGKGGGPLGGGAGGGGAVNGSKGQGGNGQAAYGGADDWAAGGGGGGGGYWGGGGGGQGFRVAGTNGGIHTRGGGGGGGSNYADPAFTAILLAGCAQPPFAKGNSGTGANGHGGFARISYHLAPEVAFTSAPRSVLGGASFDIAFSYTPADASGPGIDHYIVGTATDPNATFPTSQSTYMVTDHTATAFTHTFTAPAAGVQNAYFVQAVDTDGDASPWLKQKVTGLAAASTTPVTITSPAPGATFEDSATLDWTVGTQTPLVAYKVGLSGHTAPSSLKPVPTVYRQESGWRRGGSRVNLAVDPGFTGGSNWTSTSNAALVENDATHPGVSGKNGRVPWTTADDNSAEQHTSTYDNLAVGTEYRLHLGVASNLADDKRPIEVTVYDANGLLAHTQVDLSATAAGTYVYVDLPFTPTTQGVYFSVIPSASGTGDGDALVTEDFEDGSVGTWTGVNGHTLTADTTESYNGETALKISGTNAANQGAQKDITALLTAGAGDYVLTGWGWSPTGSDHSPVLRIIGTGTSGPGLGQGTSISDWSFIRFPFHWDGTGSVSVQADGDGLTSFGGKWYDLIQVWSLDTAAEPSFGNTDSQQTTYLSDMLIEMTFEGETTLPAYFDGSHLNGLSGSVSWEGTAGASPSYLTGTDVVTDTVAYSGAPLLSGALSVTTLATGAVVDGFNGAEATVLVDINPTPPATPTVVLTVDSNAGLMVLAINANDTGQPSTNKTVTFDIFRNGTRIVTGLAPDVTTREAVYDDVPASGETSTYVVRAWSQGGGYADQANGTVN